MADFRSQISLLFRDQYSSALATAARRIDDVTGEVGRMARGTDRAGGALAEMGRFTDRAGGALAEMARDTDRTGGALAEMARDADRAGRAIDRVGDRSRDSGRESLKSTGIMQGAWKGLDILDDIGGVIGMIDGLTAGFREMAAAAIESSRQIEAAIGHLASVNIGMTDAEMAAVGGWADSFAFGQEGVISELSTARPDDLVGAMTTAMSSGLNMPTAQEAVTQAAGLSMLRDAGTIDDTLKALTRMSVNRDEGRALAPQYAEWANMMADAQRRFNVPALSSLTASIETSVKNASGLGVVNEEWLAFLGAAHRVGEGTEVGEGLNSLLEESLDLSAFGMQVPTADGKLQLKALLQQLRDYRESREDLRSSDVLWTDLLQEEFGELGGKEISAMTGRLWDEFSSSIEGLREAATGGALVERLKPIADTRQVRAAQIDIRGDLIVRQVADDFSLLDEAQLARRESIQERAIKRRYRMAQINAAARSQDPRIAAAAEMALQRGGRYSDTWASIIGMPKIAEILQEGIALGAPALGDATSKLLRAVDDNLPHSDARRGPLSELTASGRAIPGTLAEGVLQEADMLTAAVTATLALPSLPALAPLFVEVLTGDVAPPALPSLPAPVSDVLDGDPDGLPPRGRETGPPAAPALLTAEALQAPPALLAALREVTTELRALRGETRDARTDRRPAPAETRVVIDGDLAADDAIEWLSGLGGGA